MKISSPRALEFACHSSACRPPTSGGTGGSGGGKGGVIRDAHGFPFRDQAAAAKAGLKPKTYAPHPNDRASLDAKAMRDRIDRAMGIKRQATLKETADDHANTPPMRDVSADHLANGHMGRSIRNAPLYEDRNPKLVGSHALNMFNDTGMEEYQANIAGIKGPVTVANVVHRTGTDFGTPVKRTIVGGKDVSLNVRKVKSGGYSVDGRYHVKTLAAAKKVVAKEINDVKAYYGLD